MQTLSLRGTLAPCFFALAIAAGVMDMRLGSSALTWLSLLFTALGLGFARDSARLLGAASIDDR